MTDRGSYSVQRTFSNELSALGTEPAMMTGPSFPPGTILHGLLAQAVQEFGCAAGAIVADGPSGEKDVPARVVASLGYVSRVIDKLTDTFSQVEQQFPILQSGKPMFWADLSDFNDTALARKVLIPAGYSDGSSTSLYDNTGHRVGRLHVSFVGEVGSSRFRPQLEVVCRHASVLLVAEQTKRKILAKLTPRELVVLQYVVAGDSNAEIARELSISSRTVAAHVASMLAKTRSRTRTDMSVTAARLGIA